MRVTQSMLSNNMLRNLSGSYNKMGKLQDQLTTGKKVNRPSDDPVVAIKGMGYRMQVDKVEQYKRNLGEVHNLLDSTDDALDKVGQVIIRIQELTVDAANDTKTQDDRNKILQEIKQLREHVQDLANSKVGDKYIFSGTNTLTPLYNKATNQFSIATGVSNAISIEVFDGVSLDVTIDGKELFEKVDTLFADLETAISTSANIDGQLGAIDDVQNLVLETRALIGARQNRAELMDNRLNTQEVISKKQMSENEDIDYEKVITEMITHESIHRAALSVGARIIQPSLVDFLR
ncbi:flagellar hook-associated protein FlgL [Sporosarcina sp. UB5]|uniref:flagellar hook-associated protein FlgL n=1 Tax=Sporosarcina sp. UB5 TaxID=3047463 RepID=UPI003D792F3F